MNIFYLDHCPTKAAQYHCDKHVVKMILESAQLLCTAHRILDANTSPTLYKATHINHPSAQWTRLSINNYLWLYSLFSELCKEYRYRYYKGHACERLLEPLRVPPKRIPSVGFTPMPQCMPDQYKVVGNSIEAYRNYYAHGKTNLLSYKRRGMPEWLTIKLGKYQAA